MIDRWLDRLTPRTVRRWAVRVAVATGTAALLALVLWALELDPWHGVRPVLYVMVFLALVLAAAASAAVVALASCHLAIGRVFGMGYRTAVREQCGDVEPASRPDLRVVE